MCPELELLNDQIQSSWSAALLILFCVLLLFGYFFPRKEVGVGTITLEEVLRIGDGSAVIPFFSVRSIRS